jgi:hypothetical protein
MDKEERRIYKEDQRLLHYRSLFTAEQLEDADAREMGRSVSLLKEYAEETKECAPGGIVDQRIADIDRINASLPEQERDKRSARLAKQKSEALGGDLSGLVPRAALLEVKKHPSNGDYAVIDTMEHEAVAEGISSLPLAHAVTGMVGAQPEYQGDVAVDGGDVD